MFAKAASFIFAAATLVAANPTTTISCSPPKPTPEPISQCNTGKAQCCNSSQSATSSDSSNLLGLLGVVVQGVDVLAGLGCTPISVIGVGSGVSCDQKPLCCEHNEFNGLINLGCTPISL